MGNRPLLSLRFKRRRYRRNNGRVKCPWSPMMFCDLHKDCPMESRQFLNILEAWIDTGRTPRTIDLEAAGQGYGSERFDIRLVAKAEIYRLFADPEGVIYYLMRFFEHKHPQMHKALCKDLSRAKYVLSEINKGFTRKQGEEFYKAEAREIQ